MFYYQQDPCPDLEEFSSKVYEVWTEVWPNPLDVTRVSEEAGGDIEKAASILQQPEDVRLGLTTWDRAIDNVAWWDGWDCWASQNYLDAVKAVKRAYTVRRDTELKSWQRPFGKDEPEAFVAKALDSYSKAEKFYDQAMAEFLGQVYTW
ncbi:hypothetical protein AAF712_006961 [Marasmius tenuissimus]|uniref:Uncharacterized protein n=1 Tax=Marasmius tenuissimus TaxID=585030 RepID=A0ABR2ZWA3_9AGAR